VAGEKKSSVYSTEARFEFEWILFRACLDWSFARDVVGVHVIAGSAAVVYEVSFQS
jgi:hypothetical protein